jgi:hypothetical protein
MPDHISSEILEHGDIFFFYRPKVGAREVTGVDDIRRFLWLQQQIAGSCYRNGSKDAC